MGVVKRKVKYSIVKNGKGGFFVLESTYYFGINLVGILHGKDNYGEVPFETINDAVDYKLKLKSDEKI